MYQDRAVPGPGGERVVVSCLGEERRGGMCIVYWGTGGGHTGHTRVSRSTIIISLRAVMPASRRITRQYLRINLSHPDHIVMGIMPSWLRKLLMGQIDYLFLTAHETVLVNVRPFVSFELYSTDKLQVLSNEYAGLCPL